MMAWLKCLIVSTTTTDELRELTRIVIGLEGFEKLCNIEGEQIVAAKDPLYVYFAGVAQKYQSCQVCFGFKLVLLISSVWYLRGCINILL